MLAASVSERRIVRIASSRRGISLTEIMVVMIIIAIVAAISLAAFVGAFGRAREANTQALIEKVDRALNSHLNQWISRTQPGSPNVQVLNCDLVLAGFDIERAQVIARKRLYKEEFPQFFIVLNTVDPQNPVFLGDWDPLDGDSDGAITPSPSPDQQFEQLSGAAREYRQIILETHRRLVNEAVANGDPPDSVGLVNHDPTTAPAECLYMILLRAARSGSSESDPENFPHSEVHDSDGDGLPELIDGWGNPLRFYRAPIFYESPDVQKGSESYALQNPETREEDQYDPSRFLLMEPWWTSIGVSTSGPSFERAASSRNLGAGTAPLAFHVITDPVADGTARQWNWNWDPAVLAPFPTYNNAARAYKASPLIVSAGPDGLFGIYPTPDWMRNASFLTAAADRQLAAAAPKITDRFLSLFSSVIPPGALQEVQLELDNHLDNLSNHELRAE